MSKANYHIYADASGDDGFSVQTDPDDGSSRWLAIAPVIMKAEDLNHNQHVLAEVKKAIGCKQDDEIKWRTLRRHPKKKTALTLLEALRIELLGVGVWKEAIKEPALKQPRTETLEFIVHTLWLNWLPKLLPVSKPKSVAVIVDHHRSETLFMRHVSSGQLPKTEVTAEEQVPAIFDCRPPNDSRLCRPLQIADIYAGILRDYLENLPPRLPYCEQCRRMGWQSCSYKRKKLRVGQADLIRHLGRFLPRNRQGRAWEVSLFVRPPAIVPRFSFVECLHL